MAEATSGRIIIDHRGTEKNVLENTQPPAVQAPSLAEKIIDKVAPIVAGAALSEAVDFIQEKLHENKEKPEEKNTEEKQTKAYNFNDIETNLMSGKLDEEKERYFQTIREARIDEFNNIDSGDFVRDTRITVSRILRDSDWDDVYDELIHYGESRESEMRGRAEIDDRLNGIAMAAVRYEAARVLVAGLRSKRDSLNDQTEFVDWISNKKSDQQYSPDELNRLKSLSDRSFVQLAPDAPEELVGKNIKKEESQSANELNNEAIENGRRQEEAHRVQEEARRAQESEERLIQMMEAVTQNNQGITIDMLREAMGQTDPKEIKKLYRDAEKGMYPIPSGLEVPKFLIHSPELVDQWNARSRLSSACNFKRMAKGPDELGQNVEAQAITNEQLQLLLEMPGVLEAKSLESFFIKTKKRVNVTKKDKDGKDVDVIDKKGNVITKLIDYPLKALVNDSDDNNLKKSCPENIFRISEGKHLEGFRQAKIYWLKKHRGLNQEQAEDAEVISRNLTFLANELEAGDSRYDDDGDLMMPPERKFASPTVPLVKSLGAWQLIHMQERLQAKTENANETWSPFGPWALRKRLADPNWSVSSEKLLPTKLIPDAFEYTEDGSENRFSDIFLENGKKLLQYPDIPSDQLHRPNFGDKMSEGLFSGYSFLALSPASTIFKILTDPSKFDLNWNGLGNAFYSCEVDIDLRDKILLGLYGVDPNTDTLSPIGGVSGKIGFSAYKKQVLVQAPDFYRVKD